MKNFPYRYKETPEILKELKVLLVDDDYLTTAALEMFLLPHIPNLISLNSAINASYYLENNTVDLLITDYWMSDLTGTELIKIAKKHNPDICTILLTVEDKLPVAEIVNLGVDRYLKKPALGTKLLEAIEYAVHRIILKKILLEKQQKELELMKFKEKYHEYHQKEAFKKQLNILKDDLRNSTYLRKINIGDEFYYFKTLYKPREILSGDCYSIREISDQRVFIYLIDIMGKGLSSSVTAINSASILNYLITKYSNRKSFPIITKTIEKFLDFIKTVLLEEEIICALFVEIDFKTKNLIYANFSMPPIFVVCDGEIELLRANQLPISKETQKFEVKTINIADAEKLLLVSDGIVEAKDKHGKIYFYKLRDNLMRSNSMKEFIQNLNNDLDEIPDDVTAILIKKVNFNGFFKKTFKIKSSLDEINSFVKNYCRRLDRSTKFRELSNKIGVVLTELLLNAHEHGNLSITTKTKDSQIEEEAFYERFLHEIEEKVDKFITINIVISNKLKKLYISVEDEGEGFDRALIDDGVFSRYGLKIVDHLSSDFFYNLRGNQSFVVFDIIEKAIDTEELALARKADSISGVIDG